MTKSLKAGSLSLIALTISLGGAGVAVSGSSSGASQPRVLETIHLDSWGSEKRRHAYVGPAVSRRKLAKGLYYVAVVKGTFAYRRLVGSYCGRVEERPMRRSRGRFNGRVSQDVEFIFAEKRRGDVCPRVPQHWSNFQISTGLSYRHLEPIGARRTRPDASHRYRYLLKGRGQKAKFRLRDVYAADNYGVVTIQLRRATRAEVESRLRR